MEPDSDSDAPITPRSKFFSMPGTNREAYQAINAIIGKSGILCSLVFKKFIYIYMYI